MADMGISSGPTSGWQSNLSPLKASDQILLKVALEGKSYQEALEEVRTQTSAESGGPDPSGAAQPAADTLSVDLLEIHAERWELHLQDGQGRTLDASGTHVSLRAARLRAEASAQAPPKDPLVIDFSGEGPTTTGARGAKVFDLGAEGQAAPTSFVSGDTAFLVLDRNGDGIINDGGELFGDQHGAVDGYAELATFDANQDARIDAEDPVFAALELWRSDGSRTPLAASGIASLDLVATALADRTSGGDAILARSLARKVGGGAYATYALGLRQFDTTA